MRELAERLQIKVKVPLLVKAQHFQRLQRCHGCQGAAAHFTDACEFALQYSEPWQPRKGCQLLVDQQLPAQKLQGLQVW